MGSCQNLAYYLSVCSLTRYVGNLIIHCSSLSENMYSKCSIFYFVYFSCGGVLGKKRGYILYAYVLIARTQMEKRTLLLLFNSLICGVPPNKILIHGFCYVSKAYNPKSFHHTFKRMLFNSHPYNIISLPFNFSKRKRIFLYIYMIQILS